MKKSQKPNLDTYPVLMPQVLVDAACPQGSASTCCTFQTIIYPKEQQVHTIIFDAYSDGIYQDLKQGAGLGQAVKKEMCIHSKHESTSNQPKKTFKELSLSSPLFHLAIARRCLTRTLEASFREREGEGGRERGANVASHVV